MNYVYYFIDKNDTVIYVGKTKNIKRRMKEHFFKGHLSQECYDSICQIYVAEVNESQYDTEICETLLINQYKPIYNKEKKFNERLEKTSFSLLDLNFKPIYLQFYDDAIEISCSYIENKCYDFQYTEKEQIYYFIQSNLGILKYQKGLYKKYCPNFIKNNQSWFFKDIISFFESLKNNIDLLDNEYSCFDKPIVDTKEYYNGAYIAFPIETLEQSNLSLKKILILIHSNFIFKLSDDFLAIPLHTINSLQKIEQVYCYGGNILE